MSGIVILAPLGVGASHGILDQARRVRSGMEALGHDVTLRAVRAPNASRPDISPSELIEIRELGVALRDLPGDDTHLVVNWANYGLSSVRPLGVPWSFSRRLQSLLTGGGVSMTLVVHEGWDQPNSTWGPAGLRAALQRQMLVAMVGLAERVVVNCRRWQLSLAGVAGVEAQLVPTPSSFPVLHRSSLGPGQSSLAVFGALDSRTALLRHLLRDQASKNLPFTKPISILDIGAGSLPVDLSSRGEVRSLGYASPAAISAALSECAWGVVDLPGDVIDKSSVVGTFRGHGLHVLNLRDGSVLLPFPVGHDGLQELVTACLPEPGAP